MQFRKASLNDLSELKRIAREVIRHNYTSFLGAEATSSFIESGLSDKEIEDEIDRCILLENDGTIVAFSIIKEDLLHLIMVDVPFQNAGHGTALLAHVEAEMFTQFDCIHLQTFKENSAASQFYEKHGWQISGQTDVPEMGLTMVQYQKEKPAL